MKHYSSLDPFNHLKMFLKTFLAHRLYKKRWGPDLAGAVNHQPLLRAEPEGFATGLQVTCEKKLPDTLPVSLL